MSVDVSVIIVSWNTRYLLDQCLRSYYESQQSVSSEVIVVDNASCDGSAEMVRLRYPEVTLLEESTNTGYARANNRALDESHGRYIVLLNSDTVVLRHAIGAMVGFADRHQEVGIVGPCLLNGDGTLQPSWARFPTLFDEWIGKPARRRVPYRTCDGTAYEADWVSGACLLIRRAAFEHVGPLDVRFFMYSEDVDWCYRAKRSGWRVCYYPTAQIVHLESQSSQRAPMRGNHDLWWSKVLFAAKHRGPARGALLYVLLLLRHITAATAGLVLRTVPSTRSERGSLLYARYGALTRGWLRRRRGIWEALSGMADGSSAEAAEADRRDEPWAVAPMTSSPDGAATNAERVDPAVSPRSRYAAWEERRR